MITTKGKHVYENVIDIPQAEHGACAVTHRIRPAGTPIQFANMRTPIFGQRTPKPLVFDHPTRWHMLHEDGYGVWMTDDPIEQRQHDETFVGYKGSVLVGGLGLGYAATALAQKKLVSRIVVVERSNDIASLVWDHTKHCGKAELALADLFEYLRETTETFDRAFFDIWQGDGEQTFHEVVVPLRRLAEGRVRRVDCWNEDIMRGQLSMGMASRLMMLNDEPSVGMLPRPTIDQLCEHASGPGSIYSNWSLPYWRWYRRERPNMNEAREMAGLFVRVYGLPRSAQVIERWFGERVEAAS